MTEEKCYCVYIHTNKTNGKVYIGQTKNIKKRWLVSSYIGTPRFYNALKYYGWDGFEHIIIQSNLSQEEADILERQLIKDYKATSQEYGYNVADGGAHRIDMSGENNPFFGKSHSEESLAIMKAKKYGGNNPGAKAVKCLTTGEVFPSCREAADWCGIPRQNINRCCTGGRPSAGKHPETKEKLVWKYLEDIKENEV